MIDEDNEPQLAYMAAAEASDFRMLISNSEIQAWKRCRRKWWLGHYRALTPIVSDFTDIRRSGTRVHGALAAYYVPGGERPADPLEALKQLIDTDREAITEAANALNLSDELLAALLADFDKTVVTDRAIVEGYVDWLSESGVDAQIEVVAPEQAVMVNLATVKVMGVEVEIVGIGILDAIIKSLIDGRLHFMDHKVVQSLQTPLQTLHMNEQMMHYLLLLWRLGHDIRGGAMYNMLRRVKRTVQAKPPFYYRHPVYHSTQELESYERRYIATARDIVTAGARLALGHNHLDVVYPTPDPNRCTWDCDFFSVCPLFDDGSRAEDMLSMRYKTHDAMERYQNAAQHVDITPDRMTTPTIDGAKA